MAWLRVATRVGLELLHLQPDGLGEITFSKPPCSSL